MLGHAVMIPESLPKIAIAPIAGTMRFLADGAAFFAPATILEPGSLPPVLEHEAPGVMRTFSR
jgi:hypothetical protein